ncbi:MAG: alanine racemase [Solirubrobacterales bacterium]
MARTGEEWLAPGTKGAPLGSDGLTLAELGASGLDLLGGELALPLLAIRELALATNVAAMAAYCESHGVLLAPHGKTTMAPQLFARQIDAGAWAITAATPYHLRVYRRFGIGRVFYANQLLDPAALAWICAEQRRDPGFELFCLVDSPAAVARMDSVLAGLEPERPLRVLVEVGYRGGRAGARDTDAADAAAAAAAAARHLELVGVEFYEGLIPGGESVEATLELIDAWLGEVAATVERLVERGRLPAEPLLSGGGSAYFDRVIARFGAGPGRLVLRSGCYVTQDGGFYEATSPLAGRSAGAPALRDALELWSTVLSRPEPERAIASFGKRDAPWDMSWPLPRARRGEDGAEAPLERVEVVGMNDQHAHLRLPATAELAVGDLLRCAVSHPCGAFDRWRAIPLVDERRRIVDAVITYF